MSDPLTYVFFSFHLRLLEENMAELGLTSDEAVTLLYEIQSIHRHQSILSSFPV